MDIFDQIDAPVTPVAPSPGTYIPQSTIDEAAQRMATEKAGGDVFDQIAPSPATDPNNIARALEGTAQAKQAFGLLLQPLNENWQQEPVAATEPNPRHEEIKPSGWGDWLDQMRSKAADELGNIASLGTSDHPSPPAYTPEQLKAVAASLPGAKPVHPGVEAGVTDSIAKQLSGLTSKDALAQLAAAPVTIPAFVGQRLLSAPEQIGRIKDALQSGDNKRIAETLTSEGSADIMALLGAKGVKSGIGKLQGLAGSPTEAVRAKLGVGPYSEPLPSETVGAQYGRETGVYDAFTNARREPVDTLRTEIPGTADFTRQAVERHNEIIQEGAKLGEQSRLIQSMGMSIPKPLADRISEINAQLKQGFNPQTRLPVQDQAPSETPAVKVMPSKVEPASPSLAPPPKRPVESSPIAETNLPRQELPQPDITALPAEKASDQPHISRIANRFTEERAAQGEIGEVAPGQGYSTRELAMRGLRMSTEEITQHVSDAMQGTGDPIKQASAIRGEEARLSDRSAQASRAAEASPSDPVARKTADNAFHDLTDFHNGPVARVKQNFHALGMSLQGEIPVDLGTFNGLREAWLKDNGRPPPTSVEPRLRETARNVTRAVADERAGMENLGREIDKAIRGKKVPSPEEVRNNIVERMKNEPCIV